MSFVDQVNSIKDGVLKRPEYSIPIKAVFDKAKEYSAEKKLDENLNRPEEEITL